jgi:hypothetical protein
MKNRTPTLSFQYPYPSNLLKPSSILECVRLRLHNVPLFTPDGEHVKAGCSTSFTAESDFTFSPMSIECPRVVAQRFQFVRLQIGLTLTDFAYSENDKSPIAKWIISHPTTIMPGTKIQLFVMNTDDKDHAFAATVVGTISE